MKEWSKSWKSSKQPRKQRKYALNAGPHVRHKFLGTHLSKILREKHGTRSVPVRKDDKVKIMKGTFKGMTGSVESVDAPRSAVYITGVETSKKDGSKAKVPVLASNIMITELNLNDKKRLKTKEKKE